MTWGTRRALIIILVVLFIVIFIGVAVSSPVRVGSNSVLVINVEGEIEEQRPTDFFSAFDGDTTPVQHDFTDALETAKNGSIEMLRHPMEKI